MRNHRSLAIAGAVAMSAGPVAVVGLSDAGVAAFMCLGAMIELRPTAHPTANRRRMRVGGNFTGLVG